MLLYMTLAAITFYPLPRWPWFAQWPMVWGGLPSGNQRGLVSSGDLQVLSLAPQIIALVTQNLVAFNTFQFHVLSTCDERKGTQRCVEFGPLPRLTWEPRFKTNSKTSPLRIGDVMEEAGKARPWQKLLPQACQKGIKGAEYATIATAPPRIGCGVLSRTMSKRKDGTEMKDLSKVPTCCGWKCMKMPDSTRNLYHFVPIGVMWCQAIPQLRWQQHAFAEEQPLQCSKARDAHLPDSVIKLVLSFPRL